jgi:chemotaxis protein methyltransferase CheR
MTLPKESLNIIAGMIEKALGIQYAEENHYQLSKRMAEVATTLGMKDADELFHVLREGKNLKAMNAVLDAATNNETSFFRDISMFDAFANDLLGNPEFLGNKQDYIRVWSAASSTGQEAYSLAMLLRQWQLQKPNRNYEILVTDYSERVLKQAKDGKYTDLEVHRGLTEEQLKKSFEKDTGDSNVWSIRPELKRQMNFRQVNLLEDWSGLGTFHVIFCRNVLIYQSVENKKKVISRLYNSVQPGGYLVLGAAETMIGLSDNFEIKRLGRAVYYQKTSKA